MERVPEIHEASPTSALRVVGDPPTLRLPTLLYSSLPEEGGPTRLLGS